MSGKNGTAERNGKTTVDARAKTAADGAAPSPASGHDPATGRFLPGNPGNPAGRPRNPTYRNLAANRRALLESCGPEEIKGVMGMLKRRATENSDIEAARLLLLYAVGKPLDSVDPDAAGLDEWDRLAAEPSAVEVMRAAQDGCDPALAVPYAIAEQPQSPRALKREQSRLVEESDNDGHGPNVLQDIRVMQQARAAAAGKKARR
jgi:hypothetical protein